MLVAIIMITYDVLDLAFNAVLLMDCSPSFAFAWNI